MIGPIINEFKDYVILRDMPDEKGNFIVGISEGCSFIAYFLSLSYQLRHGSYNI